MTAGARPGLAVLVDGTPLPDDEARAFWQRFSDWMEEHKGDLAGFAAAEGFASVHPGVDGGRPVLRASRTAEQKPYAPVGEERSGSPPPQAGGSGSRHDRPGGNRPGHAKSRGKRRP